MSMEFGWWAKDPEQGKYQILVRIHGGNVVWTRKQGHHTSWANYGPPTDADWEKLLAEAARRVPRRLLSPKQFADIELLCARRAVSRPRGPLASGRVRVSLAGP